MRKNIIRISGIYFIKNKITGRVYVGSSADIQNRYRKHIFLLRHDKHDNQYLQNSWNKHGEKNFELVIVEEGVLKINLLEREGFYIQNTEKIFNIHLYPSSAPYTGRSEADKEIHREMMKERMKGEKNPFYGKKLSEKSLTEMKRKLSIIMTGENNPFFGKHHSEETKAKLSEKLKGRVMPESFYEKQKGNARGAKKYKVITPNGEEIKVFNLKKFCEENGLFSANAYEACSDNRIYKGYRFYHSK